MSSAGMSDLDLYKHEEGDRPVERSPRGRYIRFDIRLGTGAYKTVYKAYDTDQGIDVAWNAIDIGVLPASEKTRIIQEVQLLQKLEHKNIINFYGSWFSKEKNQVVFITEIMTSGTLKSYIKRVQFVKWKIIKRWCIQILEGLHYLHSQNPPVIHRDLKCDNIFINGNTGDLRIGDLGLSTQLAVHKRSRAQSVLGTPEFMAPELYDESYDEKVDIYAFGMCVLEMVTKEVPYSECINPAQIYKKVTAGIRPRGLQRIVSQAARDFIELCLSRGNGEIDVSAEYLLDHPFLKAHEDDGEMIQVLPDEELEREVPPPAPVNARSFSDHLDMESGSKGKEGIVSLRRQNHPSLSLEPEELGTGSASASRASSLKLDFHDESLPAEEKSAGKHRMLLPTKAAKEQSAPSQSANSVGLPPLAVPPTPAAAMEPVVDEPLSDKKDVDHNVEQFLSTMPGSESKIRNDRIAVMGGRGHRIDIDEAQIYSDDDSDRTSITSTQDSTSMPTTQVARDADRPASVPTPAVVAKETVPRSSTPDTVPRLPRPQSAPRKRGKRYEFKATKDPEIEHSILLNLRIAIDGKSKEIKFPFHLFTDSPHEVACELAVDVGILEPDLEDITDSISFLVTEGKINNLPHVEQEIWDEAPEPHSFSSKPLPHVSKMIFGPLSSPKSPPASSPLERKSLTSLSDISHDMGASSSMPQSSPVGLGGSSGLSGTFSDLSRNVSSDSSVSRHESAALDRASVISDRGQTHLVHAASETSLYNPDEWAQLEVRERGVSMGSTTDPHYMRSVRQFEDRLRGRPPSLDDRDATFVAALKSDEEHQREIERIRQRMQELNEKTARATLARQERMRLGTDEFRTDGEAGATTAATREESSSRRDSVHSLSSASVHRAVNGDHFSAHRPPTGASLPTPAPALLTESAPKS
ncbi:hypothetical protein PINS_up009143 [Pythium insidiosum]|nr:hypothetical protein PINS_up009143 [Pythium insidiosum]